MGKIWEPLEEGQLLEQQQRYFAKMCVGTSTVRSQGPEGTKATGQRFLTKLDLNKFSGCGEDRYRKVLNRSTTKLASQVPGWGQGNWGAARKLLNIFLFHCTMNQQFVGAYDIGHMRPFLELTLDNLVVKFLKRQVSRNSHSWQTIHEWTAIRNLRQPLSKRIQAIAQEIATELGCNRCDLDFLGWRDP